MQRLHFRGVMIFSIYVMILPQFIWFVKILYNVLQGESEVITLIVQFSIVCGVIVLMSYILHRIYVDFENKKLIIKGLFIGKKEVSFKDIAEIRVDNKNGVFSRGIFKSKIFSEGLFMTRCVIIDSHNKAYRYIMTYDDANFTAISKILSSRIS